MMMIIVKLTTSNIPICENIATVHTSLNYVIRQLEEVQNAVM